MSVSNDAATYEFRNPYAAPDAVLHHAYESYDRAPAVAGRAARLLAYLVDMGVLLVGLVPIVIAAPEPGADMSSVDFGLMWAGLLVLLAMTIYNLVRLARHGQTIGKQVIGIRIVRSDGSDCSLLRLLGLRYLVPGMIGAVPLFGMLFTLIDVLWIFGEEKRCVHDLMADTIVVG